jgi:prepilin-type N-terminal cleavage/methylation domain-containing protein
MRIRTRKAFTLLELMVAFIIMAILAAVAIPSLANIVANSQKSADQSTALNLAHAAYFTAQSEPYVSGTPVAATIAGSGLDSIAGQVVANPIAGTVAAGTPTTDAKFAFTDGNTVCVSMVGYPTLVTGTC